MTSLSHSRKWLYAGITCSSCILVIPLLHGRAPHKVDVAPVTSAPSRLQNVSLDNRYVSANPFVSPGTDLRWGPKTKMFDKTSIEWLSRLEEDQIAKAMTLGMRSRFKRLFLEDNESVKPIMWPADLEGHVQIKSKSQALEFLRLFSSRHTWNRFPEFGFLELNPVDRIEYAGDIKMENFSEMRLPTTDIEEFPSHFRILRSMVRTRPYDQSPMSIVIADETVTREGEYTIRVLAEIPLSPDQRFVSTESRDR